MPTNFEAENSHFENKQVLVGVEHRALQSRTFSKTKLAKKKKLKAISTNLLQELKIFYSWRRKYHMNRGFSQEYRHHLVQSKFSGFFRYGIAENYVDRSTESQLVDNQANQIES